MCVQIASDTNVGHCLPRQLYTAVSLGPYQQITQWWFLNLTTSQRAIPLGKARHWIPVSSRDSEPRFAVTVPWVALTNLVSNFQILTQREQGSDVHPREHLTSTLPIPSYRGGPVRGLHRGPHRVMQQRALQRVSLRVPQRALQRAPQSAQQRTPKEVPKTGLP